MKRYFVLTVAATMAISAAAFAQKETTPPAPAAQSAPPDPAFRYVEQMPEPGYDVTAYLRQNVKYPPGHDTTGGRRVTVEFIVNTYGSISDVGIMGAHKVPKPYQEESLRLIQNMPKWKPGKQNGRAVRVHFMLPVTFYKDGK